MAKCVVTIKIMPLDPSVDLAQIQSSAEEAIDTFTGESAEKRVAIEPIAFGLKAVKLTFVMDESLGGTEPLESALAAIEGVNSAEVVDVRRAIG